MKKNLFARLSCGALALAMLLSGCGKTETGSDGGSNGASRHRIPKCCGY